MSVNYYWWGQLDGIPRRPDRVCHHEWVIHITWSPLRNPCTSPQRIESYPYLPTIYSGLFLPLYPPVILSGRKHLSTRPHFVTCESCDHSILRDLHPTSPLFPPPPRSSGSRGIQDGTSTLTGPPLPSEISDNPFCRHTTPTRPLMISPNPLLYSLISVLQTNPPTPWPGPILKVDPFKVRVGGWSFVRGFRRLDRDHN